MFDFANATEYPESALLVGAATSVWDGSEAKVTIKIAVSAALNAELVALLGGGIESVFITDSDIRHIKKTHGTGEQERGQLDISPQDFAAIPLILNEFDSVRHTDTDKLGNKKLLIIKDIGDLAYIATVQRGRKKMEIKTFWKTKVSGASC
jgi:hypothetical protein